MLAIVSHFISQSGEVKSCLLGLRHIEGSHSGENIAQSVIAVLEDYEIKDLLGYFILNNVSSNNIYVQEILKQLQPSTNPKKYYLCCFSYIVNLATKAFLFSKEAEAFELEIDSYIQLQQEEKELRAWRKLGPIRKLYNVIIYIRKTPQRCKAFLDLAKVKEVEEARGKLYYILIF